MEQLKKINKRNLNKNKTHNQFCTKYYLDKIKKDYGVAHAKEFHDFYRRSHERCCNKNCKDYPHYKGKFKYKSFIEFYYDAFPEYLEGLAKYPNEKLSIDRIDGSKGYEKKNIRFVPMRINLQNKYNVKAVKMENIHTGESIYANSFGELANKLGNSKAISTLHKNWKNKTLYKKEWKISKLS